LIHQSKEYLEQESATNIGMSIKSTAYSISNMLNPSQKIISQNSDATIGPSREAPLAT
jgi:hypothetical protein